MHDRDLHFLRAAVRLALRGHGGAEPNPLVGCVIVSRDGRAIADGYHRHYGGPHAEIVALQRAGNRAAGATLYCTLEPCNHKGKTGPCTEAIIAASIARVVIARRDPNPPAAGGIERLRNAGIQVELNESCPEAIAVSDPFVHRLNTGLPWVTVKWAQTLDGKIATRTGDSKWISNESSRTMVHRERGRVDVILTGIGTVLKDDPMLTARDVRVRRVARRVMIDPNLRIPLDAKLVQTSHFVPTEVVCDQRMANDNDSRAELLRERGVQVIGMPSHAGELPLQTLLRDLSRRGEVQHVLVEAGTRLMSRLFQQNLVNEAWVFVAPRMLGDPRAKSPIEGIDANQINDGIGMRLINVRRRGGDAVLRCRV